MFVRVNVHIDMVNDHVKAKWFLVSTYGLEH